MIDPADFLRERRRACAEALRGIAARAWAELAAGAPALDVVEHAVAEFEDCELFNAGRGSVLNRAGEVELDAAIMDGSSRAAGAVAAVRTVRNPVRLARAVLRAGEHVMLVGPGAEAFALAAGVEPAGPDWLVLPERREQLARAQAAGRMLLEHEERYLGPQRKSGTVGAVARDVAGHLAAATSTGGMTNKHVGRVGDSPVVGAGVFADDATCAVSGTGHGEYFIRGVLAHDVHARIAYAGAELHEAARAALRSVAARGGHGGLIAVGSEGAPVLLFDTPGMYRAWIDPGDNVVVAIYDEPER